ncbi:MAG: complex I NDUFA9 subunit family protein [Alphaproteobacteria bacterium]|nr:complex I NDUFA9 subunit family protein [Alphaproteobacteria bacterium]
MQGKVITIYGGSGFLGRYITQELAELGAIIRVGVRYPEEAAFLKPMGSVAQITPIAFNITSPETIDALAKDADILINCVGILSESKNAHFNDIHHKGAEYIALAAQKQNVERLIHISALGANLNSPSIYAQSKEKGEAAIVKIFPDATILRPSVVFGSEDQFFNRFAKMAQLSPFIPLIGGGKTKFQPIYVNDIAHFIAACLSKDETKGQIFELGGPKIYTFKELMIQMLHDINRENKFIPIPFSVAKFLSYILQFFPGKPLTPDQVDLLKSDNICSGTLPGLSALNIRPTPLEIITPAYLSRYRPGGRYIRKK